MLVERGDDGAWSMRMTCLLVGMLDTPANDVACEDRAITFGFSVGGRSATASGTVSDDGQHLDGTITLEEAMSHADSRSNLEAKVNFGG